MLTTALTAGLGLLLLVTPGYAQPIDSAQEYTAFRTAAEMALSARFDGMPADVVPSIAGARMAGTSGVVYVQPAYLALPGASGGYALIGYQDVNGWHFAFPNDPNYAQSVMETPDLLLDPLSKVIALSNDTEPVFAAQIGEIGDYRLPWPALEAGRVTQPYSAHGLGQIDFWIPSGVVSAAKAGDVVYIQDSHHLRGCDGLFSRYNNAVVIRHAPDEYTLYLHIAANSVPQAIKDAVRQNGSAQVLQGEMIARQGNSGFTCGPDGMHLHLSTAAGFNVYASPDTLDEDGDGDREEAVEAVWGEPHHAVDFVEARYQQLANWPFEEPIVSLNQLQLACVAAQTTGVMLFDDTDCRGERHTFDGETMLVNLTDSDWNDRIRSLDVAPGWSTRVYQHVHGLGSSTCLSGSVGNLAAIAVGDDERSFDREISSLQVYHSEACLPAPVHVGVYASADRLQVDAAVRTPISYTFTVTGSTHVQFMKLTYTSPITGSPPVVTGDDIAIDIAVPANETRSWPTNLVLEPVAIESAWQNGQTELPLTVTFSGVDGVGRSVTATTQVTVALSACGDGNEWNDDPAAAAWLPVGDTLSGLICPAGDIDYFAFDGVEGQSIVAMVEAVGIGSMLDARLDLRAGDESTVLVSSDDVTGTLDAAVEYLLPEDGRYSLAVSSDDPLASGAGYSYTIELNSSASLLVPCIARADLLEPDDESAQAVSMNTWGGSLQHTFHLSEDEDWVRFRATAGVAYTVTASSKYVDVDLDVFASDGETIAGGASALADHVSTLVWSPQITGDYFVRAQTADANVSACRRAYRLQIDAAAHAPPQVSLRIADDLPFTTQQTVSLTLSITDEGAGISDLLIANDSSLTSGMWHEYTQTLNLWELAEGDGQKTVYAQVRDVAGNASAIVSDTIVLDSTPPRGQIASPSGQSTALGASIPLSLDASPDTVAFRLRVAGGAWDPWHPHQSTTDWERPDILGHHQVDLQVRDRAGNVSEISSMDILFLRTSALLPLILR